MPPSESCGKCQFEAGALSANVRLGYTSDPVAIVRHLFRKSVQILLDNTDILTVLNDRHLLHLFGVNPQFHIVFQRPPHGRLSEPR